MTTPLNPPGPQESEAVRLIFERIRYVDLSPARFTSGTGTPEGSVTGNVGDLYTRTDGGAGTTLYVKESGASTNTGWVAK